MDTEDIETVYCFAQWMEGVCDITVFFCFLNYTNSADLQGAVCCSGWVRLGHAVLHSAQVLY
jgi:hypothetical protein